MVGYLLTKNSHIFQRSYDRKCDLLIDLYKEVVKLEVALKKYVNFTGAEIIQVSLEKRINELNIIKNNFQIFQHKFWEVEIILEDNLVEKINKFRDAYIKIISELSGSNISHDLRDYKSSYAGWNKSFQLLSTDLAPIKDGLKSEFKKALKN